MDKSNNFRYDLERRRNRQAGGTLNIQEKLEIRQTTGKISVWMFIEAGFPDGFRPAILKQFSAIAKEVRKPIVCGLSHASPNAFDRAAEAVKKRGASANHIFLSSSESIWCIN